MRAVLILCLLLGAALARADAPLRAERLQPGEQLRLDGRLDHPAWRRAPVHEGFVEKTPELGAMPPEATRVRVLFDDAAIWVGIEALDRTPQRIRAPLVRFDQVNRTQDFVVVYLDPIGSRRAAQFFRVNAAGSRADGMHTAADDSEDFAPDFDWDAATARTPEGWTAVLRLPFASLRFSEDPAATWRIMVGRRIPREQFHLATSVLIPREAGSFIDTMQPLQGVQLPQRHAFLTLRPSLTLRDDGAGTHADASLDLKWRPRAELVLDATLNPDFSQVALDVPQLIGNRRFALMLQEKRPFFFESSDLLRSPTDALYTRSLTAPRAGLRATWRGADLAGSAFAIDDRGGGTVLLPGPYRTGFADQPGSSVLAGRAQLEGGARQYGLLAAARRYEDGRGDNLVLGPDLGWRLAEHWRLRAQWLHSRTTALVQGGVLRRGPAQDGDRLWAKLAWQRGLNEFNVGVDDIHRDFRHDTGFVGQAGTRQVWAYAARGWEGVGGLNEVWFNTEAWQTVDKATGRTTERRLRPGLWVAGPHNLEAWLETHFDAQRLAPEAPLLEERYVTSGVLLTPAPWWNFADARLTAGRMVDVGTGTVRSGGRLSLRSQLRALPWLEIEPTWELARLTGAGAPGYRESAAQLLAIAHLGPRSHLRAILQHARSERGASRPPASTTQSLTWAWRPSSGTVMYLGGTRADDGAAATREVFVKLQLDMAEARGMF
jgi:hypothetical protein